MQRYYRIVSLTINAVMVYNKGNWFSFVPVLSVGDMCLKMNEILEIEVLFKGSCWLRKPESRFKCKRRCYLNLI